ncbi:MAG TPA: nucleotidyltransferase [Thermoanaerobaculia bacterium]|nr:nucleotidyltransferase [Thermoanaerobaculia bacterium]
MNRHFEEILSALSAAGVEYLIIGAHAVAVHGYPRATKDLDIWVRPDPGNARRVWEALVAFGAPLHDVNADDFATADTIYQLGVDPIRIDLITSTEGLSFEEAWKRRVSAEIDGMRYPVIGREDLIRTKRAVGRPQDLVDADRLEEK